MRLYVQWATNPPTDWVPVNVTSYGKWRGLPTRPEPRGGEPIDATPGYVHSVMCQGVSIQSMDHYHVRRAGSALVVTAWNDPEDWPPGTRWAQRWTFGKLRNDPRLHVLNTNQRLTVYREGDTPDMGESTTGGPIEYKSWSDFVPPTDGVRHGIWLPDDLNERHFKARSIHGWREWAD